MSDEQLDRFEIETNGIPHSDEPDLRGRIPPHSVDSEQAILGAVLLDNEALYPVLEVVTAEDFYRRGHQLIFEAMMSLSERREPTDMVTLAQELRAAGTLDQAGGVDYLSQLVDSVPTSSNTPFYARVVKEMSLRRRLMHEAALIAQEAVTGRGDIDAFIDSVEQRIFQVSDARVSPSFQRVGDLVKGSIKHIEAIAFNKGPLTGVPSGFTKFDELTNGLQPGDLIIIAGRPSMGKTALALSVGLHVGVKLARRVAIFSLEMSKEQITLRLLCSEARVSNSRVRSGRLQESDFPRLVDAASNLAASDIFIDDTPAVSVLEMRSKARRLHRERPLSLIIVDYLQLMRGASRKIERREQEISEISRSLKGLAKELGVPVVALSQLNRSVETRNDKRPMMSDLRESGAIEQDADVIMFIYRDDYYNKESKEPGVAEIILAKQRNGPVGTVRLTFLKPLTRFDNLAPGASGEY